VFCGGNEMVQYSRPIGATSVIGTPTNWAGNTGRPDSIAGPRRGHPSPRHYRRRERAVPVA
jgi:hypothetical protein